MKLLKLLQNITATGFREDVEITELCRDSRKIAQGCLFVCIAGTKVDSHQFAAEALENGAAAVVCERDLGLARQILVPDGRAAWAQLCANWFDRPSEKLCMIGITGTNGKTSTSYLLKGILEKAGHTVGLVGTIQNMIGNRVVQTGQTTPDPYELQQLFAAMVDAGCRYAVMEVSSHALDQERVRGCRFSVGVFTNLTQDHLDYHGTMEAYARTKKRLFAISDKAVLNADDVWYQTMREALPCAAVSYSAASVDADYTAHHVRERPDGVDFELVTTGSIGRVKLKTPGRFSVYNALAAAACALELGISFDEVVSALCDAAIVKGRAEVVPTNRDFTVVIDYAHTPDGLQNICETLNACKAGRLVTVFGCGGDRDRTKRPKMAAIAAALSDFVVVTSDNPRTEDPHAIIADIVAGLNGTEVSYEIVPDRIEAIHWAIRHARAGDTILLAGKGHETYQILNTGTVHLDEREVVAQALLCE